jgi:hypothetical protein
LSSGYPVRSGGSIPIVALFEKELKKAKQSWDLV